MSTPFIVSYIALWVIVVVAATMTVAMYNHMGIRYLESRDGRAAQGPEIQSRPRTQRVRDLAGRWLALPTLGSPSAVFFTKPECKPCERLRGYLSLPLEQSVEAVIVCGGAPHHVAQWAQSVHPTVRVIADPKGRIASSFQVLTTPFGFAIDGQGRVAAKGIMSEEAAVTWLVRRAVDEAAIPEGLTEEVEA